jgi:D-glycero-D-manno-heptose 1,7-bisphosphate phosphatase
MQSFEKKKFVFFDRDGVICEALPRGQYLTSWSQFRLMNGIQDLTRHAKDRGYILAVVTNQSQVAKRLLPLSDLHRIHDMMQDELDQIFDAIYLCPHRNEDNCFCRKPKAGMFHQADDEHGVDFGASFMIGDSDKDVIAGQEAGTKTIFIRNAYNAEELSRCRPDFIVDEIPEIIEIIT